MVQGPIGEFRMRSSHGNEAARAYAVRYPTGQPGEGRKERSVDDNVYEVQLLKGQPIDYPIRGERLNTFVGTLKFGDLVGRYRIPHRVHATNKGYQRKASTSRINKLVRDLKRRKVHLPTSILLSVREREPYPKLEASGRYVLTIPANGSSPFFVVDGQHRLEALKIVMEEDPNGNWHDFLIPTVIIFGADSDLEMDQFHTVNSNAKSIDTRLAHDLLKTLAKKDDDLRKYLDEDQVSWKVDAQDLTERVARRKMWRGRIRFSNEPKGNTLINSNSVVSSLKRAIEHDYFATYLPEQRAEIIDAYWQGIGKALPECFRDPEEYNIQKTVGVYVLHYLLPTVLSYAIRLGCPVSEPETHYHIFATTLRELSGDNQIDGESVGSDFWKVGAEGASGTYSSGAGQRVLREKIRRELQENLSEQLS